MSFLKANLGVVEVQIARGEMAGYVGSTPQTLATHPKCPEQQTEPYCTSTSKAKALKRNVMKPQHSTLHRTCLGTGSHIFMGVKVRLIQALVDSRKTSSTN